MPGQSTTSITAVDTLHQQADTIASWGKTGIDSIVAGDGIMISIVGVLIVFASLTVISLLIRLIKKVSAKKKKKKPTVENDAAALNGDAAVPNGVSGEIVAAIATALQHHLFELHDEERTIITIKKVSRSYSPWSSKLYGMTPSPFKNISQR